MANKYKNITESSLVKETNGTLKKVIINSHTSGTLKLVDGIFNGVAASGVLTSAGACAPADYATSTLTSSGVNVTADDTVTIDTTVYTFKAVPSAAYEVDIGADAAATLDNLKAAINATGTAGTTYGTGTLVHPTVIATTNTDTTQVIRAKTIGTAANSIATTSTAATLTWTGATMASGVAVTNATVTIDTVTYTFVLTLPDTLGYTAVPYYVLWVTSEAVALDNLKLAINATGTPGTTYSAGTLQHPTVVATTNTNTEQTVVARQLGTAGNSIATTETLANYSWGAATLASGTGSTGKVLSNTITFSAVATTGEREIDFGELAFDTALLAVVGGTVDLTLVYD